MAYSSGTSSGSSTLPNSGSEGDLQLLIDQRKRKRMLSNRESARRSRMRKQNHLDDLIDQVNNLRKENNEILSSFSITTQHYLGMEAENSVLRTQVKELSSRLDSLNEIILFMNRNNNGFELIDHQNTDNFLLNPLLTLLGLNHPIMASAEPFLYG